MEAFEVLGGNSCMCQQEANKEKQKNDLFVLQAKVDFCGLQLRGSQAKDEIFVL